MDTIKAHQQLIKKAKSVYWGWWRKGNGIEPTRLKELEMLSARVTNAPLEIGIYDRSALRFFKADLVSVRFSPNGGVISSPDKRSTPDYYSSKRLPAWFELKSIKALDADEFADLFGSIPLGDETLHPINALSKHHSSNTKDADYLRLTSNKILHISDVHFGDDHGKFKSGKGNKSLVEILTSDVRAALDKSKLALIVQSGDLTSRGQGSYLQSTGLCFMRDLCKAHDVETACTVMVPGNHDYNLRDSNDLTHDHEVLFTTFMHQFYGNSHTNYRLHKYKLPDGRCLEVMPIDSVRLRDDHSKDFGWVEWPKYENLLQAESDSLKDPNLIRIAVIHHHLAQVPRTEQHPNPDYKYGSISITLNSIEVIEGLQKHRFSLVLHGHQHVPAVTSIARAFAPATGDEYIGLDQPLYIVAGGSAGVKADRLDDEFRDNSYCLLSIEQDHILVEVRRYGNRGVVTKHLRTRIPR